MDHVHLPLWLFFGVALSSVQAPSLDERIESTERIARHSASARGRDALREERDALLEDLSKTHIVQDRRHIARLAIVEATYYSLPPGQPESRLGAFQTAFRADPLVDVSVVPGRYRRDVDAIREAVRRQDRVQVYVFQLDPRLPEDMTLFVDGWALSPSVVGGEGSLDTYQVSGDYHLLQVGGSTGASGTPALASRWVHLQQKLDEPPEVKEFPALERLIEEGPVEDPSPTITFVQPASVGCAARRVR